MHQAPLTGQILFQKHFQGCTRVLGTTSTKPAAVAQLPPQQQQHRMLMPLLLPTAVFSSRSSSRSSSHRAVVGAALPHRQQLQDTVNLRRWYMQNCRCMVQC
jgi:hypothetical protein